jgi:choline dehydrogenase-like flavoprotein
VGHEGAVSDYVVVGAGSAGSVVVVRRLLDAGHSVHLIEAGGRYQPRHSLAAGVVGAAGWAAGLGGCSPHRSGTRTIAGCSGRAEGCWVAAVR